MSRALAAAAVSIGSGQPDPMALQFDLKRVCFYCKEPGHIIAECEKRIKKELRTKENEDKTAASSSNLASGSGTRTVGAAAVEMDDWKSIGFDG